MIHTRWTRPAPFPPFQVFGTMAARTRRWPTRGQRSLPPPLCVPAYDHGDGNVQAHRRGVRGPSRLRPTPSTSTLLLLRRSRLLLLVLLLLAPASMSSGAGGPQNISFLHLTARSGSGWVGGLSVDPAIEMAFDHINADATVLPNFRLVGDRRDTECTESQGVRQTVAALELDPPPLGIVSVACSAVAQPVASFTSHLGLVTTSGIAASASLSDVSRYPLFLRTLSPDLLCAPAMVRLCERFKWKRVAAITELQDVTSTLMDEFRRIAPRGVLSFAADVTLATPAGGGGDGGGGGPTLAAVDAAIDQVLQAGSRIVFAQVHPYLARFLFCRGLKKGALGQGRVWVIPGKFSSGWWKPVSGQDVHGCTLGEMAQAAVGYLAYEVDTSTSAETPLPNGITPSAWRAQYQSRLGAIGHEPLDVAPTAYDAVWAWGLALHTLLEDRGMDLASVRQSPTLVYDTMRGRSFHGASGHVSFGVNGDRVGLSVKIENSQVAAVGDGGAAAAGEAVEVHVGSFSTGDSGITMLPGVQIEWWFNTSGAAGVVDSSRPRGDGAAPRAPGLISLHHFSALSGSIWTGGVDMAPYVALALDDVNAATGILPSYVLGQIVSDTACDPDTALAAITDVAVARSSSGTGVASAGGEIVGVLGPSCSGVSSTIEGVLRRQHKMMVSGSAGASSLSDKTAFPAFLRSIIPDAGYTPALFSLIRHYGWRRVACLAQNENFATDVGQAFRRFAETEKIQLIADEIIATPEIGAALQRLGPLDPRVIMVNGYGGFLRHAFCDAYRRGLTGSGIVFIVPGWEAEAWWKRQTGDTHDCSDAELMQATQGYLAVNRASLAPNDVSLQRTALIPTGENTSTWRTRAGQRYPGIVFTAGADFGVGVYHAVWAWAFALQELLEVEGLLPHQLTADSAGFQRVRAQLYKTDFEGLDGRVSFDPATGDRLLCTLAIENQQRGVEVTVANTDLDGGAFLSLPRGVQWWYDLNGPAPAFDLPAPLDGSADNVGAAAPPEVLEVLPAIGDPVGGQELRVVGRHFRAGAVLTVTIAGKLCSSPTVLSPTRISCMSPPGVGADVVVVVSVDGVQSAPVVAFAYVLPLLYRTSRQWIFHEGNDLSVVGDNFVRGSTYCRLGDLSASVLANVRNRTFLQCQVRSPPEAPIELLQLSNDAGQRWTSGLVGLEGNVAWLNGSTTTPGAFFTNYDEISIVGVVPNSTDPLYRLYFDAMREGVLSAKGAGFIPDSLQVVVLETESTTDFSSTRTAALAIDDVEATVLAHRDNVVGIIGGLFSVTSTPIAFNVSNKYNLPMVTYDAWTSVLSDPVAVPYFVRSCTSNTNVARQFVDLFGTFKWTRVGVITSDDPFASNLASAVARNFSGEVVSAGTFDELPVGGAPGPFMSEDEIYRTAAFTTLHGHTLDLIARGIRIFIIAALSSNSWRAIIHSLGAAGANTTGFAVVTVGDIQGFKAIFDHQLSTPAPAALEGMLTLTSSYAPCEGPWCGLPCVAKGTCAPTPKETERHRSIHDAVLLLMRGLQQVLVGGDGGKAFKDNTGNARQRAMAGMRTAVFPQSQTATGTFRMTGGNDRDRNDFRTSLGNVQRRARAGGNGRLELVTVGNLIRSAADTNSGGAAGSGTVAAAATGPQLQLYDGKQIQWPGGATVVPRDRDTSGVAPPVVTIGWVETGSRAPATGAAAWLARREQYARWLVDRINANGRVLPNTRVVLAHTPNATSGAAFTAECEELRRRAAVEGRPLVGMISSGTSRTKETLGMSPPAPTVSYASTQTVVGNSTLYPWVVRVFPGDSQRVTSMVRTLRKFKWTRVFQLVDAGQAWASAVALQIQQEAAKYGIVVKNYPISNMRAESQESTEAELASAMNASKGSAGSVGYACLVVSIDYNLHLALKHIVASGYWTGSHDRAIFGTTFKWGNNLVDQLDQAPDVVRAMASSVMLIPAGVDVASSRATADARDWPGGALDFLTREADISVAYLYDAILLLAYAIEDTIGQGKSPLVATEVVKSLRRVTVQGITGEIKIAPDWNNIKSRSYNLGIARVGGGSDTANPSYQTELVGQVLTDDIDLRVCGSGIPAPIGPTCAESAAPVPFVHAFAESGSSMHIDWGVVYGGTGTTALDALRSGYRVVLARDGGDTDVNRIFPPDQTSATFGLDTLRQDAKYTVKVEALFDGGLVASDPAVCRDRATCRGSLACIPDTARPRTCECDAGEMHTLGLTAHPQQWECRTCLPGLDCTGGTANQTWTRGGFFAVNSQNLIVNDTSQDRVESIFPCPFGQRGCPGRWRVSQLFAQGGENNNNSGDGAVSIKNDASMDSTGRDVGDMEVLYTQCAPGFTGVQCAACKDGFASGSCTACPLERGDAIGIAVGALAGAGLLGLVVYLFVARLSRAPSLERLVIEAFKQAELDAGIGGPSRAFTRVFDCESEQGVDREAFTKVVLALARDATASPKASSNSKVKVNKNRAVARLWTKLDVDNDGHVSGKEFLTFYYRLSEGTNSTNPFRARVASILAWWRSDVNVGTRQVIVTFLQLFVSIPRSFPEVRKAAEAAATAAGAAATPLSGTATNGTAASNGGSEFYAEFVAALQPVFDLVSNINVQSIEAIQCMVGPRHYDRLSMAAGLLLAPIGAVWLGVLLLSALARVVAGTILKNRLRAAELSAVQVAFSVTITIASLLYPLTCAFVLRTWVCKPFVVGGETRYFMADDTLVECRLSTGPYIGTVGLSIVFIFVIVLGIPVLQVAMLRRWVNPINRLYVPTDQGVLEPSTDGKAVMGDLFVVYSPRFYWWGVVDSLSKLLLASVIGVAFAEAQNTGMAITSVLCCGFSMVVLVWKPFAHHGVNFLASVSYAALAAMCIEQTTRIAAATATTGGERNLFVLLDALVLLMSFLVFALGSWLLLGIAHWKQTKCLASCLVRLGTKRVHGTPVMNYTAEKEGNARARLDEKRTQCFHALFNDLTGLGLDALHKYGSAAKVERATCVRLVKDYNTALTQALESLAPAPLELSWKHLECLESAAKALSRALFRQRFDDRRKTLSSRKKNSGIVALAFLNAPEIWSSLVVQELRAKQADGNMAAEQPSIPSMVVVRNAVVAMLVPSSALTMGVLHLGKRRKHPAPQLRSSSKIIADTAPTSSHPSGSGCVKPAGFEVESKRPFKDDPRVLVVTPKSKRAAVTPTGTWSREDDGSGIHMRNPMIQVTRGGEDGGETKVQRSTSILQHVSADLRGDAEVVLEAVKRNGNEMEHASPDLRRDKAFIIKALRQRSGTSSELPPLGNGDVAQHSPSSPSVVGSSRSDPVLARLTPHQRVATLEASRTLERFVRSAEDSECAV